MMENIILSILFIEYFRKRVNNSFHDLWLPWNGKMLQKFSDTFIDHQSIEVD